MNEEQVEDIFDWAGCSSLYKKHGFKIWVSGMMNQVDSDILESFLDHYSFEEAEELYFDEFQYHFQIYKNMYEKNGF
ncbi:hypothetical protein [Mesobacillus harenae]|uniref:hypothetical protein n=1 Tax=Mesobacillus harenae TaxID=2213203 RepID=UPI0015808AFE|nr:hypothetical protein [Mesobacillus harenae]